MPCEFKDHTLNTVMGTVFAHTPHEALSVAMAEYRLSYDGHGDTARINDIRVYQDSNLIPGHFKIQIGAMFDDNPQIYTGSVRPAKAEEYPEKGAEYPKLFMSPDHLARLEAVEERASEVIGQHVKVADALARLEVRIATTEHKMQSLLDNIDNMVRKAIRDIVAI